MARVPARHSSWHSTLLAGAAASCGLLGLAAARGDPLLVRNESMLTLPYGLPGVLPARLSARGDGSAALVMNWANTLTIDDTDGQDLHLDGETQEFRGVLDYGIAPKFAVHGELAWRHLSGGSLDGFISDWHSAFGLPYGERHDVPPNQLRISYTENGKQLLYIDQAGSGLADIPVSLGYQIFSSDRSALATWFTVKAPVGTAKDLTGSEATDLAITVAGTTQLAERWQLFGQADLTRLGRGKIMPEIQEDYVWSALGGLTWNPWRGLDLTVQINANSKIFRASSTHVGGNAVVLGFGGDYRTANGWRFDLGFDEDLQNKASPDIVINLAARHGF